MRFKLKILIILYDNLINLKTQNSQYFSKLVIKFTFFTARTLKPATFLNKLISTA